MSFSLRSVVFSELTAWLVLVLVGLYLILPLTKKLRFGMDLKGGTYLTLGVDVNEAIKADLIEKKQAIRAALKKARKAMPAQESIENNVLTLDFASSQTAQEAVQISKDLLADIGYTVAGSKLKIAYSNAQVKKIAEHAVARNIEVLQMRLDRLGVAEIPIAAQGDRNIVIELPDVFESTQIKKMIGTVAQLDFKLVSRIAPTQEDLLYDLDDVVPHDKEILPGIGHDKQTYYYLVDKYSDVTGKYIKDARAMFNPQNGEPIIDFRFTPEGGEKFYELTSANIGKPLAIVLDGKVVSAPSINVAIRDSGMISGNFTTEAAKDLAMMLKSGAFAAPVVFEEERQVDPLLGKESIKQGLMSCVIGLALLFCFVVPYYKLSGLAAFSALLLNLLFTLVGMALLGATLTLPGIAGMVLTVGMAIDASVLVFERIKELLAEGSTPMKAVKGGFAGAMTVIIDANLTTFIVGIVLYYFGTGPIKGFAVTMMLGILATLITGLFYLRSVFNFALSNCNVKKLSI